jgi:hypothetical protein
VEKELQIRSRYRKNQPGKGNKRGGRKNGKNLE